MTNIRTVHSVCQSYEYAILTTAVSHCEPSSTVTHQNNISSCDKTTWLLLMFLRSWIILEHSAPLLLKWWYSCPTRILHAVVEYSAATAKMTEAERKRQHTPSAAEDNVFGLQPILSPPPTQNKETELLVYVMYGRTITHVHWTTWPLKQSNLPLIISFSFIHKCILL